MENNVKIELNVQMINVILGALAKMPLEQSIDTFMTVKNQVESQMRPDVAPPQGPMSNKVVN